MQNRNDNTARYGQKQRQEIMYSHIQYTKFMASGRGKREEELGRGDKYITWENSVLREHQKQHLNRSIANSKAISIYSAIPDFVKFGRAVPTRISKLI